MNKLIGKTGEDVASDFLANNGYEILERNLRLKIGEIDILAAQDDYLVIVEVKSGKTGKYGPAYLRVGPDKIKKLNQLALALSQKYPNRNIRIDVVNVDDCGQVIHIENAVESN